MLAQQLPKTLTTRRLAVPNLHLRQFRPQPGFPGRATLHDCLQQRMHNERQTKAQPQRERTFERDRYVW